MGKDKLKGNFIPNIPMEWIQPDRLTNGSIKTAICIWYFGTMRGKKDLPFTHKMAQEFGLGVKQVQRSLKELEDLKMIACDRGPGRSPRITILENNDA